MPGDGGYRVVHCQIAGDGLVIDVVLETLRHLAEQPFIDKRFRQFPQGIDFINVDFRAVRIIDGLIVRISTIGLDIQPVARALAFACPPECVLAHKIGKVSGRGGA